MRYWRTDPAGSEFQLVRVPEPRAGLEIPGHTSQAPSSRTPRSCTHTSTLLPFRFRGNMALRLFAGRAATSLGIRCQALGGSSAFAFRTFSAARKYLPSHEWIQVDGEVGTVGITDFAQSELGEVVFVDLPEPGTTLEKGKTFGVVESVKAASDVYSPVSGEVVEANKELSSNPGLVNSGPFAEGWIMKVKLSDPAELDALLDDAAYAKRCEEAH